MPSDPEIVKLEERRAKLKGGQYRIKDPDNEQEIRELGTIIRSKRAQREKAIRQEYHDYYFHNRPTWDIKQQARGEEEEEYIEPAIELNILERAQLAEILCKQPETLGEENLLRLRIQAAELMVALSHKRETAKQQRIRQREPAALLVKEELPEPDAFPLLLQDTQCPDCIGDESLPLAERKFPYCRRAVRNDHFDDKHLEEREQAEQRGELQVCKHPKCIGKVKLRSLDHFRNHVASVHNIPLRSADEAAIRRARRAKGRSRGARH
jgi:hypothetical protein